MALDVRSLISRDGMVPGEIPRTGLSSFVPHETPARGLGSPIPRRAFLRWLGVGLAAAAATTVLDPEAIGWGPGRKAFSKPPAAPIVRDPETGISIRWVKEYRIESGVHIARYDVLYGVATLRPDLAIRLAS